MSWGSEDVCFKGKLNKKRKRKFVASSEETIMQPKNIVETPPSEVIENNSVKKVKFEKNVNFDNKKEKLKEKRAKIIDDLNKNLNSKKSKRQLKREKNETRLAVLKTEKSKTFLLEVLNYLSKWEHNREEWKYEKKKNFYIFNNILNEDKIPDQIWNIVLEYVNNSTGNIKEKTIKEATKVLESVENDTNNSEIDDKKYERARTLIQFTKQ